MFSEIRLQHFNLKFDLLILFFKLKFVNISGIKIYRYIKVQTLIFLVDILKSSGFTADRRECFEKKLSSIIVASAKLDKDILR